MVNFILDAFKLLSFLISQKSTAGESAFCLVIAWEEKKIILVLKSCIHSRN